MKINNVNMKLLAGLVSIAIISTNLAGCKENNTGNGFFDYSAKNEQGQIVYVDEVLYSTISNYKVVVFEKDGENSIYIAKVVDGSKHSESLYRKEFYNIFEGTCIYNVENNSGLNIVSEELLSDYLVMYDKVQKSYTADEIEELLEQIKQDYSKDKDKTLVKK